MASLSPPSSPQTSSSMGRPLLAAAVLGLTAVMAGGLYAWFWEHARLVWWWPDHDRHAHYLTGLNLAWDLRTFDLARLRHDLDGMRVWGPLHGLLVSLTQLVGGTDPRLAVLPSLLGWVLTVWFGFLLARRLVSEHGNLAGLATAAVLAALPAYRAFATDVMLESLGAGLSLMVLYFYLVAVQDRSAHAGRPLVASLLALFFLKYNYWLLVVFGLVVGEFLRCPGAWLSAGRAWLRWDRLGPIVRREVRQPLSWLALILLAAATYIWRRHGTTLSLGSLQVSLQKPHNLFMFGFWALFARLVLWWRHEGRDLAAQLPPPLRTVLVWHGWVSGVWFLLPKRLGFFLWYISPANVSEFRQPMTTTDRFWYYLGALGQDYCYQPWGLYLLLGLAALALVLARRLRPGSAAVIVFFLVAAFLTVEHPAAKSRHVHSWVAAGWALAAAGLFVALGRLHGWIGVRATGWMAAVACVGIAGLHAPGWFVPGQAPEGGPRAEYPSPLVITDTYLPQLSSARHATILSNVPARHLFGWTFIDAHRHLRFETEIPRFRPGMDRDPEALARWLDRTPSDAIVLVEVDVRSPFAVIYPDSLHLATLEQVLTDHDAFTLDRRWELPEGVGIRLWRKHSGDTSTPRLAGVPGRE